MEIDRDTKIGYVVLVLLLTLSLAGLIAATHARRPHTAEQPHVATDTSLALR